MRQLQGDIEAHLVESDTLRLEKEAAEDRCAELTGRAMVLLDQMAALEEDLAAAREAAAAERAQRDAALHDLHAAQVHAAQLAEQVVALEAAQVRVAELEGEREESGQWCEGMSAQLRHAQDELQTAQQALAEARQEVSRLEGEVAAALARAASAEADATGANTACCEVRVELAEAQHQLEAVTQKHAELVECLGALRTAEGAATARAAEAEAELAAARDECSELAKTLDTTRAAKEAVEQALQRRLSELEAAASSASGQHAALDEVRRRQVEELQTAVQAGSAACTTLAGKLEAAGQGHREAVATCERLKQEAEERKEHLEEVEAELRSVKSALAQVRAEREELAASAAAHQRSAELLEMQCSVLRGQVEFLQASQAKDASLSDGVRERMAEAYDEQRRLRERLQEVGSESQRRAQELEQAMHQVAQARAEADAALATAEEAGRRAEDAAVAAKAADAARAEAERRCAGLEQQLELSELLKDQGQREVEVAREQAAAAAAEAAAAHRAAEDAERRRQVLVAEMELIAHDACAKMASQLAVLARVEEVVAAGVGPAELEEAVGELAALEAEHQQVAEGGAGEREDTRAKRTAVIRKLAAVRQGVARLAGHRAAEVRAIEAVAADAEEQAATWAAEREAMRAVCKLALALMMDQVGGRDAAAATLAEVEPMIASNAAVLEKVGLAPVWASLRRLAASGVARRTAEESKRLSAAVEELTVRCARLEALVKEERSRADCAHAAMLAHADRVRDLAGSVRWATGDVASGDQSGGAGGATEQLEDGVEELSTAVHRLVRRYRSLTRTARDVKAAALNQGFSKAEAVVTPRPGPMAGVATPAGGKTPMYGADVSSPGDEGERIPAHPGSEDSPLKTLRGLAR